MNRRPPGLSISKAVTGFLQFKVAEGLSPTTTFNYERILNQWLEYQEDIDVVDVTNKRVRDYLT